MTDVMELRAEYFRRVGSFRALCEAERLAREHADALLGLCESEALAMDRAREALDSAQPPTNEGGSKP